MMTPTMQYCSRRIGSSAGAAAARGARATSPATPSSFVLSSPRLAPKQSRRRRAPNAAAEQAPSTAPSQKSSSSSSKSSSKKVTVVFLRDGAVVNDAVVGEPLADVARRAGVESIQYGCHTGNCGVCEVELRRYSEEEEEGGGEGGGAGGGGGEASTAVVVRACVAVVPASCSRVEVDMLDDGGAWGLDGWDT